MKIYHNPRCTKSRQTLQLLENQGHTPEIIKYLEKPPSKEELSILLEQLGMRAEALLRKNEAIFKENYKGKTLTEEEWIAAMVENPKLIERPIVVKDGKAMIGRPPENVLKLF